MTPTPTSTVTDCYEERYIICDNCEGHEDGWSVKVGPDGDVTALECRDCGGSDWHRRSW